jgi:hypothetical protein
VSTFNGFGTMYYGWRRAADGASTATKWATALFFPLLPLRRRRLRPLGKEGKAPAGAAVDAVTMGAATGYSHALWTARYEVLEETPRRALEVLGTYARAYVALPLALGWPAAIAGIAGAGRIFEPGAWPGLGMKWASLGVAFAYAVYIGLVLRAALRGARGLDAFRGR